MNKKLMVLMTILLGFFCLMDFGYTKVNFGVIEAIKNKRNELIDEVEKKKEEISALNNPPNIPSNPSPANGATEQSVNVDLFWTGSDSDAGDTLTYDLYFGSSANPPLLSGNQSTTTYDPGTLSKSSTYYWKVVAKDNNGAFTFGPVWRFETSHWGTAQLIEINDVGTAWFPQVAINSSGNGVAVWYQGDGTRDNIWSNSYELGTGWGTAQLIETDNTGSALYPQVAIDSGGNAIAVWYQYDGTRFNIWSNRYVAGTGWGIAQLIESDNTGNAHTPQVAIDSSGNAIAVWLHYDGLRYNVCSNRYEVGTGWGTAQLIENDNAGRAYNPQVAINSSGNAVAVWYQSDGSRDNICSNSYELGTGWGTAQLIETDDAGNAFAPQVAIDSSGNAIAVWYQYDAVRHNIWSNRYVSGTGWGATAQLIETNNAEDARSPQVAIDSSGNAIAVWVQDDGSRDNIWSNKYVEGTGWGTAQLIETDNTGRADNPQIAIDSNGNAIAVWVQSDGAGDNIWSNRYEE